MKSLTLLATTLVTCIASSSFAIVAIGPFDGTSVTGTISFNGAGQYFSPTTTTIGPGVEFTYSDAANTDTADFSGSSLTITDVENPAFGAAPWVMTFTDSAFAGGSILIGSDNFVNGITASLSGDTITVSWDGEGAQIADPQYTTSINITPGTNAVPDGGATVGLLGIGLLGLGAIKRKIASR